MTYPYVEHPQRHDGDVRIWLDDEFVLNDRDTPPPEPDLVLSEDDMNAVVVQWLQGPPGPKGPKGPKGDMGYPLDIDLVERVEALERRLAAQDEAVQAKERGFWPDESDEAQDTEEQPTVAGNPADVTRAKIEQELAAAEHLAPGEGHLMAQNDYRGTCVYCGKEVRGRCARELSQAWEVERAAGGANQVSGPKRYSGEIAHIVCFESAVRVAQSGLAGQESLLA